MRSPTGRRVVKTISRKFCRGKVRPLPSQSDSPSHNRRRPQTPSRRKSLPNPPPMPSRKARVLASTRRSILMAARPSPSQRRRPRKRMTRRCCPGIRTARIKNYRAALDRFNDALLYKPGDAEAIYGLAVTQEKLDLLAQANKNYQEYLKILPSGPHAKEAQDAIKRLGPHVEMRNDAGTQVEHDIEVGETYLSMNNFDAARERFEDAVRLAPENAKACFRLAQSLQGLRRIEPARLYYQKYLELEPQGPFAANAKKAIADINAFLK